MVVEEVRGGQSLRVWKAALTDGLRPKGPSAGRSRARGTDSQGAGPGIVLGQGRPALLTFAYRD